MKIQISCSSLEKTASSLGGSWDSEEKCAMHQIFSQRMLWREIITSSSLAIKLDLIHSRRIKVAEDAACVFMWLRQSMPSGIYPPFYWPLQGEKRKKAMKNFFQDSLSLSQESGGKQRWHASILKSCTNFASFESSSCVHNGWMSSRNVNSLMMTWKKNNKKKSRKKKKGFTRSRQEVMAGNKLRAVKFKIHSGITDVIACTKTTHRCLISCQHITSTTQGCTSSAACCYAQMTFLCLSVRFLQRTSLVWILH